MKLLFFILFFISIVNADINLEEFKSAVKNADCPKFYSFLSSQDKKNQTESYFCSQMSKILEDSRNDKIFVEIINIDDKKFLQLTLINEKGRVNNPKFPVIQEGFKTYISFGLKTKEDEEKSKIFSYEVNKIEKLLCFPLPEIEITDYDERLKLLNRYLELTSYVSYTFWEKEKIQNEIENTQKAKNIDTNLINIIKPQVSPSTTDDYGFFSEVQNKTTFDIKKLILKVSLLDNNKNTISDKEIKIYDLNKNYIKDIGNKIYVPSIWENKKDNLKVEVKYIEL